MNKSQRNVKTLASDVMKQATRTRVTNILNSVLLLTIPIHMTNREGMKRT